MSQPPQPPGDPPRAEAIRWQALFRRSAEPLFLLNRHRRILFANEAWQALTGIPLREARGLVCKRYRAAEPGSREAVLHALNPPSEALAGRPTQARCLLLRAGGAAQTWEVAFFPFRDADGLLGILGRVTVEAAGPAAAGPLPARLAGLRDRLARWHRPEDLGGDDPPGRRLREQVRLAGQTVAPVLLLGEAGSGKQWTARVIHQQGPGSGAFVALDCRHLPARVVEAVLFEGGGLAHRPGVGTLYLAEPHHLPRELQARLAERAAILPGPGDGRRPGPRLLAGCAADPQAAVRQGPLLEELHCALGVLTVMLAPLRERQADFPWLVRRLLTRAAAAAERPPAGLTADAWEVLRAWSWPGNLRELYAVLQGACRRAAGEAIAVEDLPWYLRSAPPPPPRCLALKTILQDVERRLIEVALRATGRNKTKAARLLGVWRALLVRRIKELGVEDEGK